MKPRQALQEAIRRIEQALEDEEFALDLGDLPLRELPAELSKLTDLRVLVLGDRDFKNSDEQFSRTWWEEDGRDIYVERWFDSLEVLLPLTGLTGLGLNGCRCVNDFGTLGALSNLRKLDLGWCDVRDIASLAGLRKLRELSLAAAQVSHLHPLAELSDLHVLDLRACEKLDDIRALTALVNLQDLNLSRCKGLIDFEPLAALGNLERLNLHDCDGLIDLKFLGKLVRLEELDVGDCDGVVDIAPIERVRDLHRLDVGGCRRIVDLSPLSGLPDLRQLDLRGHNRSNNLAYLAGLSKLWKLSLREWKGLRDLLKLPALSSLRELNLSECSDLSNIESLTAFASLRTLDLSGCNGLRWSMQFEGPPRLHTLTLRDCKGNWAFEPLRPLLTRLETLHLYGSSFPDLPKELSGEHWHDNSLAGVRAHFADLDHGADEDTELKVFVLGNGGAGKTQLCRRLRGEPFDPKIPSTHGVQLVQLSLPVKRRGSPVRLCCWDFGGQDIYHGTHALFLQNQAVFVVLWSPDLEQGEAVQSGVAVRNRPLSYWLDYIRGLAGTDSPVLVIQGRCDEENQRRPLPTEVVGFRHVETLEFSALTGLGLERLKEVLVDSVARVLEVRPLQRIGVGRIQVRERLRDLLNQGTRTLSQQNFRQICADTGKVSDQTALLDFLHRSGVVFHRTGLFADQIILDQTWALEAVYSLFHRQATLPFLTGDGRFTRAQLAALVWRDLSEKEQEIILGLMRSCGLCFPVRNLAGDPPTFEYIAPDLLPEWSEAKGQLLGALRDGPPDGRATVRYRFLHEGILRTFLSRIGEQAGDGAVYWKYGCWFCEEKTNCVALVRTTQGSTPGELGAGEVTLEVWGRGAARLVDRVLATLLRIDVGEPPKVEREKVSRRSALPSSDHKGIEDLKIIPRSQLSEQGPRRVYVSYAWGDESPSGREREAVVDRLCDQLRAWAYRVERDKDVLRDGDLISDFIVSIGRADRIIVVLSDKYLRSPYCMNELHQIYSYSRTDRNDFLRRMIPLTLADAAIGTIRERLRYAQHWEAERDELRPMLSRGIFGPTDYAAWTRINRWVSDVSEMLAHINDKLHPHGFDAIIAENFVRVRELLENNCTSKSETGSVTRPPSIYT